jgi:hypothetical protein
LYSSHGIKYLHFKINLIDTALTPVSGDATRYYIGRVMTEEAWPSKVSVGIGTEPTGNGQNTDFSIYSDTNGQVYIRSEISTFVAMNYCYATIFLV